MSAREGPTAALATRRVPCDTAACLVGPCAWDRYLPPSATSVPASKERDNGKGEGFCAPWESVAPLSPSLQMSRTRPKGSTRRWFWPASILACRNRHRYTVEQN